MTNQNCGEQKIEILNKLSEIGCCKRCALRFLGEYYYDNPQEGINQLSHSNSSNQTENDQQIQKKLKQNACVVCLDLLHETFLEEMIQNSQLNEVLQYDCDTFVNYISFPVAVLIREHAMAMYLKDTFPESFKEPHIVPINRAWSLSIQNKLGKKLGKVYERYANLSIQFTTIYENEHEESSIISHLEDKVKKHNGKNEPISRNAISELFKTISPDVFQKYVPVPPQTPGTALLLEKITYKHDPIFIAGRYCKFSRNLGQTPWIVDDVRVVENSVQEIIFDSLGNMFDCKGLVFSSSGREDFDVRTLGRGRPFFIKICDPKITKIAFELFRSVEKNIKQTKIVKVHDLQFIDRKCLNNIKEGEQFKQKTYRALCIVNNPEKLDEYIKKINNLSSITLQQKTPIRVYHRRSSDVRERAIYQIKARTITGRNNLFELDMLTQAGTYVKEFVHGDFGRTKPSLGEIIGGHVDIIALDVLDIHLDFPPSITTEAS